MLLSTPIAIKVSPGRTAGTSKDSGVDDDGNNEDDDWRVVCWIDSKVRPVILKNTEAYFDFSLMIQYVLLRKLHAFIPRSYPRSTTHTLYLCMNHDIRLCLAMLTLTRIQFYPKRNPTYIVLVPDYCCIGSVMHQCWRMRMVIWSFVVGIFPKQYCSPLVYWPPIQHTSSKNI